MGASLLSRVAAQSVAFVAFLAALAMGSARTTDYWQAWAFTGVMLASVVIIDAWLLVYDRELLERRMKMGEEGEPTKAQKLFQKCAGTSFFAMFVVSGLDHHGRWSAVPRTASIAADAAVGIAFALVLIVFRANTFASSVVEVMEDQKVISTGPYALVRHPMYSAGTLLILAIPIALGSWWALVCAALLVVLIVARLLDEEKMLAGDLKGYREYMEKTKSRLIPGVW